MLLGDRLDVGAAISPAVVSVVTPPTTILLPLISIDLGLPLRFQRIGVM
jgi:hypothetical protein